MLQLLLHYLVKVRNPEMLQTVSRLLTLTD